MQTIKFNEDDREQVLQYLENQFSVKLIRVGKLKVYWKDESDKRYFLIGASGDWHGIPLEIFESEEAQNIGSYLIIAKRYQNKIDIFLGSLAKLIRNKTQLHRNQKGEFQFNTKVMGKSLTIKEIPHFYLEKIGEINYQVFESKTNLIKKLKSLPKNQLEALLKELQS